MATLIFLANNQHVYLTRPFLLRTKILLSLVFILVCFIQLPLWFTHKLNERERMLTGCLIQPQGSNLWRWLLALIYLNRNAIPHIKYGICINHTVEKACFWDENACLNDCGYKWLLLYLDSDFTLLNVPGVHGNQSLSLIALPCVVLSAFIGNTVWITGSTTEKIWPCIR